MTDSALIHMSNIIKTYTVGGVCSQVLKGVSLTIKPGELVAIVGASGSGKSTLMNIIGLLDTADEGQYSLNQHAVNHLTEDQRALQRNRHIGFVFQQFNLLPRFTAEHNVSLPLTYRSITSSEMKRRALIALKRVGMEQYSHHRPTQLSGGQQQRVAIARALVTEPEVILADEPTGALDSRTGSEVLKLFHTLHGEGRTIIMVTHDEQVARQCQRRIVLADGQIISESCS